MKYERKNRHKYILKYHLIFVCKYRKKLLINNDICDNIKQLSFEICNKSNVKICIMETDKDHIHYLIEIPPTISISNIVNKLKSYTTYHIWKYHNEYLSKQFWKEHTFWSDGYFISSVGEISDKTIKEYIEQQGK